MFLVVPFLLKYFYFVFTLFCFLFLELNWVPHWLVCPTKVSQGHTQNFSFEASYCPLWWWCTPSIALCTGLFLCPVHSSLQNFDSSLPGLLLPRSWRWQKWKSKVFCWIWPLQRLKHCVAPSVLQADWVKEVVFHGRTTLEVLNGSVNVYGYAINNKSGRVRLFAPCFEGALFIRNNSSLTANIRLETCRSVEDRPRKKENAAKINAFLESFAPSLFSSKTLHKNQRQEKAAATTGLLSTNIIFLLQHRASHACFFYWKTTRIFSIRKGNSFLVFFLPILFPGLYIFQPFE